MIKKYSFTFIFLLLTIFPIFALFHPGFPVTHDGQDHVARIANFYLNLTEGNFIPRWAPNLNWGYGHPVLEFLYPLPSYIASFFHFLYFSFVDSVKIVYGIGMVLSFYFMYLWLSQFSSKYASLFGAVLYTYAPYRFVELYVRGDIGENLAFAFIPLVLYAMYKLYKKLELKYFILGTVSLAFLILSHNAISLMFIPLILLYGLILAYLSKKRLPNLFSLGSLIFLGFTISAFFWVPAFFEGKYTLRNIVTAGSYVNRFTDFKSLIYGPWNYGQSGQFTVQFGLFQWLSILFSPVAIYFLRKDKHKMFLGALSLFFILLSIFLMLPMSDFIWSHIVLLQNFQFPWRFLALVVFFSALLGTIGFEYLEEKLNAKILTVVCIGVIVLISMFYARPKAYQDKPPSFYSGIYASTTDTGESSPIWSVRGMGEIPSAHLEVVDGRAIIKEQKRISTYHTYNVNVESRTLFIENTLYFPGWKIIANKTPIEINFQNKDYRGIMTLFLNKGDYKIEVIYGETRLRLVSDLISGLSFIIMILLLLPFVRNKINKYHHSIVKL